MFVNRTESSTPQTSLHAEPVGLSPRRSGEYKLRQAARTSGSYLSVSSGVAGAAALSTHQSLPGSSLSGSSEGLTALSQAKAGHPTGGTHVWHSLHLRYHGCIKKFFLSAGLSDPEAEDHAAITLLQLYQRIVADVQAGTGVREIRALAYSIARRRLLDYFRSAKRHVPIEQDRLMSLMDGSVATDSNVSVSSGSFPNAEELLLGRSLERIVARVKHATLCDTDRRLLELLDEGLSYDGVVQPLSSWLDQVGLPPIHLGSDALRARAKRARSLYLTALAEALELEGWDLSAFSKRSGKGVAQKSA